MYYCYVIYQLYVDLCPESIRNVPDMSSSCIHFYSVFRYFLPKKKICIHMLKIRASFRSENSMRN